MSQYQLVFAPVAKDDLKAIYQFSVLQWGLAKAELYLEQIKYNVNLLLEHPFMGLERTDLLNGIRSLAVERHIIFYRIVENQIMIVRVLHSRQDPNRSI